MVFAFLREFTRLGDYSRRGQSFQLLSAALLLSVTLSEGVADDRSVSASKISLPSGPGSIEGLGESFEPQLNTGTYVYRIPLKLPPMRGEATPRLALEYNSG